MTVGPRFGALLSAKLKERGLSLRKFGAAADWSHSNLSKMINGRHEAPPPPIGEELDKWCGVLDVKGQERQRWHDLAALAHLPTAVRAKFETWYDEHQALRHALDDLRQRVRNMNRAADE